MHLVRDVNKFVGEVFRRVLESGHPARPGLSVAEVFDEGRAGCPLSNRYTSRPIARMSSNALLRSTTPSRIV
jgi:hypothetical protein